MLLRANHKKKKKKKSATHFHSNINRLKPVLYKLAPKV